MFLTRRVAVGSAAFLAAFALSACAEAPTAEVGDCLNSADLDGQEILELNPIPCEDTHDVEVFHTFSLPEGDFPGEDAVNEAADEACTEAFEGFVGTGYAESQLQIVYLTPLEEGWDSLSDREAICMLQSATPVTGTLEGSRR